VKKKIDELSEEEKRTYVKAGILVVIGLSAIVIPGFLLINIILFSVLELEIGEISRLAGFRAILVLSYPIFFLPGAVLVELVYSWFWHKTFRLLNIGILSSMFGEFVLVSVAIATLFDLVFPEMPITVQVPLMAASNGIALLAMAKTASTTRIKMLIKKSFG